MEETNNRDAVLQNTTEEQKNTKDESYPSVFSTKNPSQDLKRLKGNRRSFQSPRN